VFRASTFNGSGIHADWDVKLAIFDENYYYADTTLLKRLVTVTGDTTVGSYVVKNISPDTAHLMVGDVLDGPGLRPNVSIIRSIDSTTQVTLMHVNTYVDYNNQIIIANGSPFNGTALASTKDTMITAKLLNGGKTQAQYNTAVRTVQNDAKPARVWSYGSLCRANPTTREYFIQFENSYSGNNFLGTDAFGRWEYYKTIGPHVNATSKLAIRSQIIAHSNLSLIKAEAQQGFRGFALNAQQVTAYGQGITGTYHVLAHQLNIEPSAPDSSNAVRRLKMMQGQYGLVHGANLMSMSWTIGVGPRYIQGLLHDNSWIMGAVGGPVGITSFGPTFTPYGSGNVSFMVWNNSLAAISSLLDTYIPTNATANADQGRVIEPYHPSRPAWHYNDCRWNVDESEFGMIDISYQLYYAMYLAGWDGNPPP
jgi:hypothetical protein